MDFDVEQFRMGLNVELEHGSQDPRTNVTNDDPVTTGKIAWAHLNEFPDYYTRLDKMERETEGGDSRVESSSCRIRTIGRRMPESRAIWTVGHSSHELSDFARLIGDEGVEFVVDVRSFPYSRFAPQFNREEFEAAMIERGVRYLFLGDELGGRPSREEHYDDEGHALYRAMSEEEDFRNALGRLIAGVQKHRIAIMCSEGDPNDCHRRLLVGKVLTEQGIDLHHILPDGSVVVESTVELNGGDQGSLFGEERDPWRSTQSVSHKRRLSISSSV